MKRILLSIAVLFSSFTAFGQMEIIPVDWSVIKKVVSDKPDEVRSLVGRLCKPVLDTTLSFNDRVIAFYGQSLLSEGNELVPVDELTRLFNKDDYAAALAKAQEALAINPLCIKALDRAGRCILYLMESGDTTYTEDDARLYFNRAMRLFNTIAITGDGSEEYPFCVTSVADEYEFMYNYLELNKLESQSLIRHCDMFKLGGTSDYYSEKEIWFDATRPLETLNKRFGL